MAIQNYFVQVTVQKGKIVENEDGTTEKVVDSIEMDDLFCTEMEQSVTLLVNNIREQAQSLA